MTRDPRNGVGLVLSAAVVVFLTMVLLQGLWSAYFGEIPDRWALVDVGERLLRESGWVMPVIGGSIVAAYVALIPLSRPDEGDHAQSMIALRVIPWICLAAALTAVLWFLFGGLALVRGPSMLGPFIGTGVVAVFAVAFAALAASVLPLDAARLLAERAREQAVIQREIQRLEPIVVLPRTRAVVILAIWAVMSFLVPLTTYVVVYKSLLPNTPDESVIREMILVGAILLQLTTLGSAALRPPYESRGLEVALGAISYLIGLVPYAAFAALSLLLAVASGQGAEWQLGALVVGVAFTIVVVLNAATAFPGIATRIAWLRAWTPDAALSALVIHRLRRLDARLASRIDALTAVVEPSPRARWWGGWRRPAGRR